MRLLTQLSLAFTSLILFNACDEGSGLPGEEIGSGGSGSATSSAVGVGGDAGTSPTGSGGSSPTTPEGGAQATGGAGSASGGATSTYSTSGCAATPINPNATIQAKNLLCYLYSLYGKSVLSGQQEMSWSAPAADAEWIKTQTGVYPAVLGGDLLYPGDTNKQKDGTIDRANAWWKAGGITMIRYHMGAPPLEDTYDNSKASVASLDNVVKSGTTENTSFKAKLDYAARQLKLLQDAGVPVLWAPLHEVQANGWFWWSKGTGAQFVAIWKYMYDYMTTTKGLNNLIWLLPFSGNPSAAYFPGKAYVDIAGPDTYELTGQPFAGLFSTTKSVVGSTIPITLHETGKIPNPANMFPSAAPWVLFSVWCGYENDSTKNTVAEVKATYSSPYTISRDEVPNLK